MTRLLIVLASLCVELSPAQAAELLYTENFDINPGYVTAAGPNANNLSSIAFGVGKAGLPKVTFGQNGGTRAPSSSTTPLGGRPSTTQTMKKVDNSSVTASPRGGVGSNVKR
ncbi:MAG: hypothetical protein ACI8T1_004943, partial [Verrucomicrobiales bacterium]